MSIHGFRTKAEAAFFANERYAKGDEVKVVKISENYYRVYCYSA